MTPCSSVGGYQYFGGACCLHLLPTSNPLYLTLLTSILKMEVVHPFETLVSTYKRTHCHNPEDYRALPYSRALQRIVTLLNLGILTSEFTDLFFITAINLLQPTDYVMHHQFNPLNPELNPICYLLALLGAHHFLHVSRIRVKLLTLRRLMSYTYGAPILDVSRSHTTTQHSR